MSQKKNIFLSFIDSISSLFLTGLLLILPVTLTIAVFTISLRVLLNWLEPLKRFGFTFPYSEVILAIAIILVAGTLYNMFILRPIIHGIEKLFSKIPLIRPVYSGIKKLVHAFSFQDKASFTKVVRIEFPKTGIYSIGFLANQVDKMIAPNTDKKYFNIFIPTTPNPTSGFLVLVPEDEITIIDISRQDAMAMIISGGIIQPNHDK
ncbi:MAG TPA: DUF502 domain-containing protein [Candidatus Babeliales bacterium]|nr:DUF502 domain-containing protein [Candidatus Babeliales bacterium]HLC06634.1 DUF502 domain-containing protein [Candidatus Babeliales bacterium]